jgi:hypothetical protein
MTVSNANPQLNTEDEITYCAVHTERETSLRCNKCDRYMCTLCAVQTPVGYRCKQCVRQLEDRYFSGTMTDYLIVAGVAALLTAAGLFLLLLTPLGRLWFLVIFIGLPFGGLIGQLALRLTGKRRGRYSGQVAVAGVLAGGAIVGLLTGALLSLTVILYIGIVAVAVFGRFKVSI